MGLERLLSDVVRGWLDKADLDRGSGNRHDSLCHAVRILNSRVDELEAKLKPESEHAEDAAHYATGGCWHVVVPEADKTPEAKKAQAEFNDYTANIRKIINEETDRRVGVVLAATDAEIAKLKAENKAICEDNDTFQSEIAAKDAELDKRNERIAFLEGLFKDAHHEAEKHQQEAQRLCGELMKLKMGD